MKMKTVSIALGGLIILSISTKGQFGTLQAKDNTLHEKGTAILKQIPEIINASINVKSEPQDYTDCKINYWPNWKEPNYHNFETSVPP